MAMLQRFKPAFLNLLTVIVSIALTLFVAEIVLRFLPVAAALPVKPPTAENPIQRYVPNQPSTWSFGWSMADVVRGRSNAQGFLADYDYEVTDTRPLVAVVGDSFVEALRLQFALSLTGRLHTALGGRARAYVFAQSGSPLSQYVAYAQHARDVYHPERLVVSVVGNDFDESIYAHRRRNGIYHLYPRPEGGFGYRLTPLPPMGLVERVARRSALALYLMRNVGISNATVVPAAKNRSTYVGQTDADVNPARIEEGYRVIDWFLDALPQAAGLPPRHIVIVVDVARPEVYDATALAKVQTSYFGQMRSRIISEAKSRAFRVIDTEPHFIAAYAADNKRFEQPTDGHWNEHGHEVISAAVLEALADWAPVAASSAGLHGE